MASGSFALMRTPQEERLPYEHYVEYGQRRQFASSNCCVTIESIGDHRVVNFVRHIYSLGAGPRTMPGTTRDRRRALVHCAKGQERRGPLPSGGFSHALSRRPASH